MLLECMSYLMMGRTWNTLTDSDRPFYSRGKFQTWMIRIRVNCVVDVVYIHYILSALIFAMGPYSPWGWSTLMFRVRTTWL